MKKLWVICILSLLQIFALQAQKTEILVFTKTLRSRHASIENGKELLKEFAKTHRWKLTFTEDSNLFESTDLNKYKTIIFLNASGNVFNKVQQVAFKKYINQGGSFVGVHAAATVEYDWPWFGDLVGGYFQGHPLPTTATINVVDSNHPATADLDKKWTRKDEWYNYKYLNKNVNVLLTLDESTYEGGTHGDYHPISWYHKYDGGRAFYTGLGHTQETYAEPAFKKHLLGGILYCLNQK
jgi:type 1 glutamine amidotransferase